MAIKLQSAMEYLTTYGWAILIIAIVLVALFQIINSAPSQLQTCLMPAGFACPAFYLASNGVLFVNLIQTTQYPITVTALGCVNPESLSHMYNANQITPYNSISMPIGSNYTFSVTCWSNSTQYSGTIGQIFSGYLIVNYTSAYTNFPNTLYGTLRVAVSS